MPRVDLRLIWAARMKLASPTFVPDTRRNGDFLFLCVLGTVILIPAATVVSPRAPAAEPGTGPRDRTAMMEEEEEAEGAAAPNPTSTAASSSSSSSSSSSTSSATSASSFAGAVLFDARLSSAKLFSPKIHTASELREVKCTLRILLSLTIPARYKGRSGVRNSRDTARTNFLRSRGMPGLR